MSWKGPTGERVAPDGEFFAAHINNSDPASVHNRTLRLGGFVRLQRQFPEWGGRVDYNPDSDLGGLFLTTIPVPLYMGRKLDLGVRVVDQRAHLVTVRRRIAPPAKQEAILAEKQGEVAKTDYSELQAILSRMRDLATP